MAFYGYNGDAGEYPWSPNYSVPYNYDAFPIQSSISYSSYGQSTNYNYYYTSQIHPESSYSVHNSTEPNIIEKGANSLETRNIISCSTKEQDDTLFEEYDPTPYGGGYDMAQNYGKPVHPSNDICYPRSIPKSTGLPLDGFDYGSNRSPYVKEPQDQSKEMDVKDDKKSSSDVKEKPILEKPMEPPQQDQDFVVGNGTVGDDILEKKRDEEFVVGNGTIGEYGYDYGRQLQQIPYGSGLESMDLCESLFGYWPCIAKENQRRNWNNVNGAEDSSSSIEQWKCSADYLFGNDSYEYGGDGRYWDSVYSNQSYYYQQQP